MAGWCPTYLAKMCPAGCQVAPRRRPRCGRCGVLTDMMLDDKTCALCAGCPWDPQPLVLTLAKHMSGAAKWEGVANTMAMTPAHELALRVAAEGGGRNGSHAAGSGSYDIPVPLQSATCRSWVAAYRRAADTRLHITDRRGGAMELGPPAAGLVLHLVTVQGTHYQVVAA